MSTTPWSARARVTTFGISAGFSFDIRRSFCLLFLGECEFVFADRLDELVFGDRRDTQFAGLVQLTAGLVAIDDAGGFLAHAAGRLAAEAQDQALDLVALEPHHCAR